ncbi:MAG: stage V sporulation protein AA [Lachnospiraceae bacterium]
MASVNEIVYVKADQNVEVGKHLVTLGDVFSMECSNQDILNRLKTIRLIKIPEKGGKRFVISILKVIEIIHELYPGLRVYNLGAPDIIITFEEQKITNKFLCRAKVILVVGITFSGAAFSIMAFNNDISINRMFSQMYELLVGKPSNGFTILELTYSIGLVIGILVFFNHFGKKKFSVDPTPMEVEMRLYENDIQTTLVQNYARKETEIDVGQTTSPGVHRN